MDGIYVMVASKRTPFRRSYPLIILFGSTHSFSIVSVCEQTKFMRVCVCVFSWAFSETTIKITSAAPMVWVENVLRMIPFWISRETFLCACMRVCVCARECCCCIGGFSSIEKCILLSWPSNLVILWIKVIKVSIERILKCVEFLHSMNGWQFT